MSKFHHDLVGASSGSGYGGGCYCPKEEAGGLTDIGLLTAAAAAFYLLYTAITMNLRRRRKRSLEYQTIENLTFEPNHLILQGRIIFSKFQLRLHTCHIL